MRWQHRAATLKQNQEEYLITGNITKRNVEYFENQGSCGLLVVKLGCDPNGC